MNERWKTATQFLFVLVALVVSVLLAQGFSLNFDRIKTWTYWLEVATNMVIMIASYNAYYEMDNYNRRTAQNGRYYFVFNQYQANVKRFYDGDYFTVLDDAIAWKNERFREDEYNRYLHAKCGSRIVYADVKSIASLSEIPEICARKLMSERATKKTIKAVEKIMSGQIHAPQITFDDVMLDKIGDKHSKEGLAFKSSQYTAKKNAQKAVSFLVSTIVLAIIQWAWQGTDLFETIISKLTLLLGAIYSAIVASKGYIKYRTANLEERNRLLENKVFNTKDGV